MLKTSNLLHMYKQKKNYNLLKRKNNNMDEHPCDPIVTKKYRSNYVLCDTEEYAKELFKKYSNHVNMIQTVEKELNDIPVNLDNIVPIYQ